MSIVSLKFSKTSSKYPLIKLRLFIINFLDKKSFLRLLTVSNVLDDSCEFLAVSKMKAYECKDMKCVESKEMKAYRTCDFCDQNKFNNIQKSKQSYNYIGLIVLIVLIRPTLH